jgi:hypothetical protein
MTAEALAALTQVACFTIFVLTVIVFITFSVVTAYVLYRSLWEELR